VESLALQIGSLLGEGKQSMVNSATLTQFGTVVAVKHIRHKKTLQIELHALQTMLPHPNVMRCFGSNSEQGFIVLELLCLGLGRHCQNCMWESPFPAEAEPLDLVCEVCSGLAHCHSHAVVHRDLTIDNILLRRNRKGFVAVISDFGVSGILGDATSPPRGSLRHYAPEAWRKEPTVFPACGGYYTTKADVFMFGTLMYELAFAHDTGKKGSFFAELEGEGAVMAAVEKGERPALDNFIAPFAAVVKLAWHQIPSERPHASHLTTLLDGLRST